MQTMLLLGFDCHYCYCCHYSHIVQCHHPHQNQTHPVVDEILLPTWQRWHRQVSALHL
ncbi:Uncharacterised protein [Vibrio cholerae]|nr:Uncharacterised protein [Vibrio cholerae]